MYKKDNISDLKSKIKYYQKNTSEALKISCRAHDFVLKNYSHNKISEYIINVVDDIVLNKAKKSKPPIKYLDIKSQKNEYQKLFTQIYNKPNKEIV